jgi:hypothetical protein
MRHNDNWNMMKYNKINKKRDYSIKKIVKNDIGYYGLFVFTISSAVLVLFLLHIIQPKNTTIRVGSIFVTAPVLLIYIAYRIFKIKYYFKYGFETDGLIIDLVYCEDDNKISEKKIGLKCRYKIDDIIYENEYNEFWNGFWVNYDIEILRYGTKIKILINPKNINKFIIKDMYKKTEP